MLYIIVYIVYWIDYVKYLLNGNSIFELRWEVFVTFQVC